MAASATLAAEQPIATDILELPGLQYGGRMTQDQITSAVGRKPEQVRGELYTLVVRRYMTRICGIGSTPALYELRT